MIYLDACALLKLIRTEDESAALQQWLDDHTEIHHTTSELARAEVLRVVRRKNHTAQGAVIDADTLQQELTEAADALDSMDFVLLDGELLDQAGALESPSLKTLDAIHLASATRLGSAITYFVTYDHGLRDIAAAEGMPVITPA